MIRTHGQPDVTEIHQDQDDRAHPRIIRPITPHDERDRHEMMRQHLIVILAPGLEVEDEELVEPEPELDEVVKLGKRAQWGVRIVVPEVTRGERVGRDEMEDVLRRKGGRQHAVTSPPQAVIKLTKPKLQNTVA